MALVDYSYYEGEYGGEAVTEDTDFLRLYKKAKAFFDRMTFSHVVENDGAIGQMVAKEFEEFTDSELTAVRDGLCNLIETMQSLESAEKQALAGNKTDANIKSRSSGGESIAFDSKKTVFDSALENESEKQALLKSSLLAFMPPLSFRHNPFYAGSW